MKELGYILEVEGIWPLLDWVYDMREKEQEVIIRDFFLEVRRTSGRTSLSETGNQSFSLSECQVGYLESKA